MKLQPNPAVEELPDRRRRNGGPRSLPHGRFIIGTAGILAASAVFLCSIVFALSVLIQGDNRMHDPSIVDPMFLAARAPTIGIWPSRKASRLSGPSLRDELTANAILASYRRTLASPSAPQKNTLPFAIAANTEDHGATIAEPTHIPATPNAAVAEATAPTDKQLSIPEANPPSDGRHMRTASQKDPSMRAEPGKIVSQAAVRLTELPAHGSTVEGIGGLSSKRAAPDASVKSSFDWPGRSDHVAIYDISAGLVYLPDGERLEAHSGVGRMRDNPSFAHVRMLGPTPPATYALSLREEAFHGVDAIRLTPVKGTAPFGRDGLLAHTYMLRRPGDSNGCVAFADYNRFLKAFRNNEVNYMLVVPKLQDRLTGLDSSPSRG